MLNIVIPMAGEGKRFKEQGYILPKPMIDVCGKPMIIRVVRSFWAMAEQVQFIFIAQKSHLAQGLADILKGKIIPIEKVTEGALCTTLLARDIIDSSDELVVANCDQYLEWSFGKFLRQAREYDGSLVVFNSTNPHHSYALLNKDNLVLRTAEKVVISDKAAAGIYYYKKGSEYISAADEMIKGNVRTNNEFYICPIYNVLISRGQKISAYEVDVDNKHMLGTPEELKIFIDKVHNQEVYLE